MGSETDIQRICFINSHGLFQRDINLKGTVYLHSFVLNLVLFFCGINIVNNLKLVAGFTFISFSLRLAHNNSGIFKWGLISKFSSFQTNRSPPKPLFKIYTQSTKSKIGVG